MYLARLLKRFTGNNFYKVPVQKIAKTTFATELHDSYLTLVDTVLSQTKYVNNIQKAQERIRVIVKEYLMKNRRQTEFLLYVYKTLEKPENINEKKIHQVYNLANLQEMMRAHFIIQNEILNKSEKCVHKPCWYLQTRPNNLGLNDIHWFRSFMNEMIIQNFDELIYIKIMDLINEMFLNIETSLYLEFKTKDLKNFTIDAYDRIQMFKAAGFNVVAPTKMALVICNVEREESFELVDDLCGDLGALIQIHKDFTEYLDYKKSVTFNSSTNIKMGVCSWPAVVALEHFNTEQRRIFEENYGKWDAECEKRVVKLYDDINLERLYLKEKESRCKKYLNKVDKLPSGTVPSAHVFRQILNFHRSYDGV